MGRSGCRKAGPTDEIDNLRIQRKENKRGKNKSVKGLTSNMNKGSMILDSNCQNTEDDSFALVDLEEMTASSPIKKKTNTKKANEVNEES